MSFRLFSRAPTMRTHLPLPVRRSVGIGTAARPVQELTGQRAGRGHDVVDRALGDHPSAVLARARAHVDDPVGGAHRLLVVLDHDQRVAQIAQALAACESAARCRAGAGRCSARPGCTARPVRPEPICVASRMRCASPPESVAAVRDQRQVVQPDVDQKPQALADLLQDLAGDRELAIGQRQARARRSDHGVAS